MFILDDENKEKQEEVGQAAKDFVEAGIKGYEAAEKKEREENGGKKVDDEDKGLS